MFHRSMLKAACAALIAPLALSSTAVAVNAAESSAQPCADASSTVVHDWQHISVRTVYTENASPTPVGVLYLGFTSMAVHEAAQAACAHSAVSPVAAVAVAAHEVLVEYFPSSQPQLDKDLVASLAAVPEGAAKVRGTRAGAHAARQLILSRVDDGRDDESIVYDKEPGPGVWQPAPGTTMLAPWLGFVDPLVLDRRIRVDGPDPITSPEYAFDYEEVKRVGAATGADRTEHQTETADFFKDNPMIMVTEGLLGHLDAAPLSLTATTQLFARLHAAMADSMIQGWRLKYELGFWRPSQAIPAADTDGNPATVADPEWLPYFPMPSYSDYVSGHAVAVAPAMEVIRQTLGEETSLELSSTVTGTTRVYPNVSTIEFEAFHARIWGGLHFRDAMEDGYAIGHEAARRVLQLL